MLFQPSLITVQVTLGSIHRRHIHRYHSAVMSLDSLYPAQHQVDPVFVGSTKHHEFTALTLHLH